MWPATSQTGRGVKRAIELGQKSFEHVPLFSLTLPGRNPSEEELTELIEAVLSHGTYFTPTLVASRARYFDVDGLRARLEAGDPRQDYLTAVHWKDWQDQIEERVEEGTTLDWPDRTSRTLEYFKKIHQTYYEEVKDLPGEAPENLDRFLLNVKVNFLYEEKLTLECSDLHDVADQLLEEIQDDAETSVGLLERLEQVTRRRECAESRAPFLSRVALLDPSSLSPTARSTYHRNMAEYMLALKKDSGQTLEHRMAMLAQGWDEDADELNGLARWCFENSVNLEEARRYAGQAVRKAGTDLDRAKFLATQAEIANSLGDPAEAAALIERARAGFPNQYLDRQLERFKKLASGDENP